MSAEAGLEVVAEIRPLFVLYFLCNRFAALLGDSGLVELAQAARMQRRAAATALVKAAERQAQVGNGRPAIPANKPLGHAHPQLTGRPGEIDVRE